MAIKIDSVDHFSEILGNDFSILCGSDISGLDIVPGGPESSFLPMVRGFLLTFFTRLAERLETSGTYYDRVVAAYSRLMTHKDHPYQALLLRTKFEYLLDRLRPLLGDEHNAREAGIQNLLRRVYGCDSESYAANHAAIAYHEKADRALPRNEFRHCDRACSKRNHSDPSSPGWADRSGR